MKLIYRGVPYESNPPEVEMVTAGITARYRGRAYSIRYPRFPQEGSSPLKLTYRGVTYSRD